MLWKFCPVFDAVFSALNVKPPFEFPVDLAANKVEFVVVVGPQVCIHEQVLVAGFEAVDAAVPYEV